MKRIQFTPGRTGQRLPSNAKWVGRPTEYGNPFKVGKGRYTAEHAVSLFAMYWYLHDKDVKRALLEELSKYDALACSCPLGAPCHADHLVEQVESFKTGQKRDET